MREGTTVLDDGRELRWRVEGEAAGIPVLWFDGTPGSRIAWLVPEGVQLFTFDRPGYGGSTPRPGRTVMDTARDALAVLDEHGIDECHLGGWSNGGPHALATASLLGDRALGVIVLGTASPFASEHLDPEKTNRAATIAADPEAYLAMLDGFADAVAMAPTQTMAAAGGDMPASDLAALEQLSARAESSLREAVAQRGAGWFADHVALASDDWGVDWSAVTCPVVLVHGAKDTICPLDAAMALAAALPDATLEVDAQDGHVAPILRLEDAIDRHWADGRA